MQPLLFSCLPHVFQVYICSFSNQLPQVILNFKGRKIFMILYPIFMAHVDKYSGVRTFRV